MLKLCTASSRLCRLLLLMAFLCAASSPWRSFGIEIFVLLWMRQMGVPKSMGDTGNGFLAAKVLLVERSWVEPRLRREGQQCRYAPAGGLTCSNEQTAATSVNPTMRWRYRHGHKAHAQHARYAACFPSV